MQKTSLPLQKGGYVIYGVAHQHSGGTGSTLYGQVMFNFTAILKYFGISITFSVFLCYVYKKDNSWKRVMNNNPVP